ncbi:hypothetical protein SSX86_005237 [Deinandra increscens subsp. villosa]|uniref:FAF domain-containing protein n=1 Tax=Deinandra increscens subsp. villosa TaxID=3103831 RepID=A0AAP0H9V1_9ASTR
MRLKIVSPKTYNQKTLFEGWSILQSPSSHKPIDDCFKTDINTYLHNQKSLKLSQKSLELCTESLGSESGNDMSDDNAIFALRGSSLSKRKSRRDIMESKKVLSRSFPPPLMTMSGSKLFQVRPRREGGRLVIEAVETDLGTSCFRAERSQGRLQLTCWKNEKEMEDSEKSDVEMEGNVESENFQRVRRCNEDENRDKGICCNWEPSCWVAIS